MKRLSLVGLCLLFALPVLASPVTTDAIYGQNGLTLYVGPAVLAVPNDLGSATILSTVNSATVQNKQFDQSSNVEKQYVYTYDFSVLGGATGTYTLKGVQMPTGAVIRNVWADTITAPTNAAAGLGTIAIQAVSAGDIIATTGVTGFLTTTEFQGIPALSVGTMVKPTTALTPKIVIATKNITAGKINFFFDVLLSQ